MRALKTILGTVLLLSLFTLGETNAGTDPVAVNPDTGANFNRYAYANNNPYRFVDPDGRQSVTYVEQSANNYIQPNGNHEEIAQARAQGGFLAIKMAARAFLSQFQDGPGGLASGPAGVFTKAESGASALVRAKEIQSALKPATQGRVTTAVTETQEGVRIVTSSEGALRPAQRAVLQSGEVAGKGARGTHAEVNGVNVAKEMGLTPTSVSPSRSACAGCQAAMKLENVRVIDK